MAEQIQWKVSDVPATPGKGFQWTGEIREVTFGEYYWVKGSPSAIWSEKRHSKNIFPIVRRVAPMRIVLEQVTDADDVQKGDFYVPFINGAVFVDQAERITDTSGREEDVAFGHIWRIVEDDS